MKYTQALSAEYARLWATMSVRAERVPAANTAARRIIANKPTYLAIERLTTVPWWVVALIHTMECGGNFALSIAQGDPWNRVSVRVPKGRGPFKSFIEAAVDALGIDGTNKVTHWDVPRLCYELENYNGWGYRRYHPSVLTPYLWSYTNHYSRGKYVADGKWDPGAVSQQVGAMAILKALETLGAVQISNRAQGPQVTPTAPLETPKLPMPPKGAKVAPRTPVAPTAPSARFGWFSTLISAITKALTRKPDAPRL